MSEQRLLSTIRQATEHLTISIKGPKLAELLGIINLSKLSNVVTSSYTGPDDTKNDYVAVAIKKSKAVNKLRELIRDDAEKNGDKRTV
jgi:hypothetical protein